MNLRNEVVDPQVEANPWVETAPQVVEDAQKEVEEDF
jgi:hypothetical protein